MLLGEHVVAQHLFGVHSATVTDIKDPDGQGRVQVSLPWAGSGYAAWARLATLMAGANRGTWFIPDVGDEVLVAFLGGDVRHPLVLGGLWNGVDGPPESMDGAGRNDRKVIRSRNGVKVTLDDRNGQESLKLETPAGQKVTLQDGPPSIEVADSSGNSIKLEAGGITVTSPAKVTVTASQVNVSAAMVSVDAAMSKFSGVVKADTVITNAVVSSSYTPGAGNIW